MNPTLFAGAAALLALAVAAPLAAQPFTDPQPSPMPPATAAPQDVAYPGGPLRLEVDATDTERRIVQVRETIPVAGPGPITLLYPQWLPGNHAPRGPLEKIAGLVIRAGGKVVPWLRDPVDVFAFHLDAPTGTRALEIEFQYLSPTAGDQGRVTMTPEMLNLQWNTLALYPAGYFSRRVQVETSVRLPQGWAYATALEVLSPTAGPAAGLVRFKPVSLDVLVDSPLVAGRYVRIVDLDPGAKIPVRLDIFADRPELLDANAEQLERHRELVRQSYKLFGARHYDHYDFLLSLSDRMGGIGLEHHRSSEDGTSPTYFLDWPALAATRDLLPHEFAHAWNGKFRRPADLWTPNFNLPMRGSLLWVYEGQTQYWGFVLSGRSGLLTKQEALDALAATAAIYETRVGRGWRPVEDTTDDPVVNARRPQAWTSWQRSEDYYSEGQLVWLDVDTLIRSRSGGKRSLDDFARGFFGIEDGNGSERPYAFDDVVAGLNAVEPYDWAQFLNARINDVAPRPPLDGLARGGWRLVYTDTPTAYFKSTEAGRKIVDLTYSVGMVLTQGAEIAGVQWDGPAFKAGLTVGGKLIAVNGIAYDADRLKEAITAARTGGPLSLLVKTGDHYRTVDIGYRGGLRYPRLERLDGTPDLLSAIYAPRK
ncbi:peptidase M61 [Phenylobacterium sp.]|uniref:M61 family metallopeptidase n=1 Tax=Phenylobacterium sp. TaxID=1871053 RepID=UPI00286AF49A|nr:peptidase M61 [Phenylobacterium sp.]